MNDPLIELLSCVTDARRQQAKRYVLANILLFWFPAVSGGRLTRLGCVLMPGQV